LYRQIRENTSANPPNLGILGLQLPYLGMAHLLLPPSSAAIRGHFPRHKAAKAELFGVSCVYSGKRNFNKE